MFEQINLYEWYNNVLVDKKINKMNVLIACEESQVVCAAFRKRGYNAFSCDIQECSGGHPEWHIRENVLRIINGNVSFKT